MTNLINKLKIPTPKDEVKYRPLAGKQIAYVDARYVQDKLDEIVGYNNWEFQWELEKYPDDNHPGAVHGWLKIWDNDPSKGGRWLVKEDVGEYEVSKMSAIKTGVSDAFKRCAVQFGIARDLYSDDYGKEPQKQKECETKTIPKRNMQDQATPNQIKYLRVLAEKNNFTISDSMTKDEAQKLIKQYAG